MCFVEILLKIEVYSILILFHAQSDNIIQFRVNIVQINESHDPSL